MVILIYPILPDRITVLIHVSLNIITNEIFVYICQSKLCHEQSGHTGLFSGLTPIWWLFADTLSLFYKPNPLLVVSVFRKTERS